ncbi:DNA ligase 1 [Enteropsectra breve]|nr:DNA ligase 1 [Enteropsectra breve]
MAATTFLELCNTLEKISSTTKRLEIQQMLKEYFIGLTVNDVESIAPSLFLCTASIYPQYFNTELGIGESAIAAAVSEATGLTTKTVKQKFVKTGDYGIIAMENRVGQLFISQKRLSVIEVLERLRSISKQTGSKSVNNKKNAMLSLINNSSALETKYIIRLFEGKLKIGLALQTVLISLALAFSDAPKILVVQRPADENKDNLENEEEKINKSKEEMIAEEEKIAKEEMIAKEEKITNELGTDLFRLTKRQKMNGESEVFDPVQELKEAYNKQPNFENLVKNILLHGLRGLSKVCKIVPGIPLKPMLAQPVKNLTKAFSKVENVEFVSEYKYDGERVQLHHYEGKTHVFSRNMENLAEKYPDLVSLKLHDVPFIVDGEVVAFSNGKIMPFQLLSTRKRKNTNEASIAVSVCVFVFDILFYDGKELLGKSLKERRKILFENFKEIPGKLMFANGLECKSVEDIDGQFREAIQGDCEGVMIKSLESIYKPSVRTNSWIKLKNDYLDDLGDSIDMVVMGVFYGKGKRTGAYGGFLLGVFNDESNRYEPCCKIGTGFSDAHLSEFYTQLSAIVSADTSEYSYNSKGIIPDMWVKPKYVWEVKAASLSLSPFYTAGNFDGKGISLRFPRFIKQRDDKTPEEATTSNQLVMMYNENKNADSESSEFN